jgi:outer membrane receptor protein involved in Fe transport
VGYTYERITEDPLFAEAFLDARTQKVPLGLRVFAPEWDSSYRVTVTGVQQDGSFRLGPDFLDGSSRFWLTDVGASYYLPNRRGLISLDVRNLFDRKFMYQETDLVTPTLATGRLAYARVAVSF